MTDYAMTLALRNWCIEIWTPEGDNFSLWSIVEVDDSGRVLAYRVGDAPWYGMPGVALHRWFDGSVLKDEIAKHWDSDWGLR